MNNLTLDNLISAGFHSKRAELYLKGLENERKSGYFDEEYMNWAHAHGFKAWTLKLYGAEIGDNLDDYLSDYEYNRLFPLNGWERIWVNDKLTLKMILNGTRFESVMPRYYYYATERGLIALSDNSFGSSYDDFVQCLIQVGKFACKTNNGSMALGFFTLEHKSGYFYFNDKQITEAELIDIVATHPNYLYTEYLLPDTFWSTYSPKVHTFRINIINEKGETPFVYASHLRLPSSKCGTSNRANYETAEAANLYVQINLETGCMQNATMCYRDHFEKIDTHPDTGAPLNVYAEGYKECEKMALEISRMLPNLKWLGFDLAITSQGVKLMEINTHGNHAIDQIGAPTMRNKRVAEWLAGKRGC